jgi:hypothetical protein
LCLLLSPLLSHQVRLHRGLTVDFEFEKTQVDAAYGGAGDG